MSSEDRPTFDVVWNRVDVRLARRPVLHRDRIVEVAIQLADAEGIHALSMRRIAAELGSGTTSLYRHVPGKDDLLDLMVDEVYAQIGLPDQPSGDWQDDLRLLARRTRAALRQHPWLGAEIANRPPIGPNALRYLEFALAGARGASDDVTTASAVLGAVSNYVHGAVVGELAEQEALRRTGITEDQYREAVTPYLARMLETGDFPEVHRRVAEAEDLGYETQFERGLDWLLAGIATHTTI